MLIPLSYWLMAAGLVSFALMGVIHKLGDRLGAQPLGIALFTMATACVMSLVVAVTFQGTALYAAPKRVVLIALPFGASAAIALWLFQKGLRYGRIATSWLLINLSSGVPTVLSIVVYREPLNVRKVLVLLLVTASLVLLWWDKRNQTEERE